MSLLRYAVYVCLFLYGGVALGETVEFQLKNGVTGVHKFTPHTQITTVQAWIKTGSVNEDSKNNGISHFLEHILFKGTKNFKPDEIDNVVESHGGVMNAGTSKDYTTYYITLPVEHAEVAFKVISDMVFNALFLAAEIEKEKPVVVQEIQRKFDNPTYDMWREAVALLYDKTPYTMEVIGTEDNVNSFTTESLRKYYDTYYHPQNVTLVVAGDISEKETKALAEKYFNVKTTAKAGKGYDGKWTPSIKKSSSKSYERDVAQDYVLLGYQVNATAEDAPVYDVLTEILSGGEYSYLNKELKYDRELVTAVSAGDMLSKNAGGYLVHMITNPDDSDEAVKAFDEVIAKFTDKGLSASDLQKAKNRLKSRVVFQQERAYSDASEIGYSYTIDQKDYYNRYINSIDAITMKDVLSTAKAIFTAPHITYKTVPSAESSTEER
ncbi:MAG: insulinase family protein [Deferribacteraceae bacterium]|jgi:predicted Zn-dependent peptidase|nr:insulinase family protein [Deferribacteraceae bacterium]